MSDGWECPMCGKSYQFSTHPFCLKKALRERDEANAWLRKVLNSLSLETKDRLKEIYPKLAEWLLAAAPGVEGEP